MVHSPGSSLQYRKSSNAAMSKRGSSVGIPMDLLSPGDTPSWRSSSSKHKPKQRTWYRWLLSALLLYFCLSGLWREIRRWAPPYFFSSPSSSDSSALNDFANVGHADAIFTQHGGPAAANKDQSIPAPQRQTRPSRSESALGSSSCPSLLDAPVLDEASLLADSRATCSQLESSDPDWSLSVCQSSSDCMAGYVVATRQDEQACAQGESVQPAADRPTSAFIKNTFGPDSLTVTIGGPQKLVLHQPHDYKPGTCRYVYPFQMQAFGVFTLAVNLEYEV